MPILLLACASRGRADLAVTQKIVGAGPEMEVTTKCKGEHLRLDVAPGTSMVVDNHSGEIISLMHTQRQYLRLPAEVAQAAIENLKRQQAGAGLSTPEGGARPQLKPTGNKAAISGYPAEEYTATIANGIVAHLWLTTALPNYQAALQQFAAAMEHGPLAAQSRGMGMNMDIASLPGFPLRTILEVAPGMTVNVTTTAVSTAPLPDSDFTVPADYQEVKVPNLTPTLPVAPGR
ncbi:MAG: DUF4412 domain-containing protein [Verrucomicrobia bacterium]|nr:DUF4412 domain-containing protein [Verrucomicrobiota bacterium]